MNDKKLTPIWDELSAIGEAAPPGTWDNVPTNLSTMTEWSAIGEWAEIERLNNENAALKIAHARYEYVRRLNPRQFAELHEENIKSGVAFDELVDRRIK